MASQVSGLAGVQHLLQRWIDEGAAWPEQQHWAYVKPVRPAVPAVSDPGFTPRNPIDNFILARLPASLELAGAALPILKGAP